MRSSVCRSIDSAPCGRSTSSRVSKEVSRRYGEEHHAAIDGVSGAELTATWLDLQADAPPALDGEDDWQPESVPSEMDLLVGAWAQLVSGPAKAARTARGYTGPRCASQSTTVSRESCPLRGSLVHRERRSTSRSTPHRRFRFGEAAFEDLKAVKNCFGCTVNDVVLALCAGALRRYLLARERTARRAARRLGPDVGASRRGKAERGESAVGDARLTCDRHCRPRRAFAHDLARHVAGEVAGGPDRRGRADRLDGVHAPGPHRRCGSPDHHDAAV